jgi:HK97 family phage portal protein
VETRSTVSVSDHPGFLGFFGLPASDSGVPVTELSSLGVSSVWRAVSVVAGVISTLPLPTFRQLDDGTREQISSFLDHRPAGPPYAMTPAEWKATITQHILLHGNAYLVHVYTEGGSLVGLYPYHPTCVIVDWERIDGMMTGRKIFQVSDLDGRTQTLTADQVTHIPALIGDELRGYSVLQVARNSLGKTIAADRAASRSFGNGSMIRGLVTPDEDATEVDATEIAAELRQVTAGWEHAGEFAVINRRLKVSELSMSHADAQFLESREFEVRDVARWFGVPSYLLMDPGAVSTWGTGVEIQNRSLSRYTTHPLTTPIQERVSAALARPRFVEFDHSAMLRPSAEEDIPLQISLLEAGLITVNEARRRLGLDPVEGGDALRTVQPAVAAPDPQGVPQ